jgi:hypothetical protein
MLIRRFSAFRASPRFADALHRYNSRIAVRIRKVYNAYHYDQYFTEAIQLLTEKLYGKPLHPNWESSDWDFNIDTGVARQANFPRNLLNQSENAAENLKNKELKWLAKKTGMNIPILPMHTKEEHSLFVDLTSLLMKFKLYFAKKQMELPFFQKRFLN